MRIITVIYVITANLVYFSKSDKWEDMNVVCPKQCACQNAHLMDLSIARWISKVENEKFFKTDEEEVKGNANNNEAIFDDDFTYTKNPLIKYAMCVLQTISNSKDLIISLPHDLEALVILYNGNGRNMTVTSSDIATLTELKVLEIRGSNGNDLRLEIDVALPDLEYANFESIELVGNELLQRRPKSEQVDPSEHFHYVPDSEKLEYNVSLEMNEEVEIVPYEIYLMEMQKSKMLSFYGWEHLIVLRIHMCKLDELHWEIFDGLTSLRHLSLEHNNIKVIPPFAFFGAYHIKTLSLSRNDILDLHYRSLAGLFELEKLDLSHNNLTKLSEITFPPFLKLQNIDMRHNPIKYIFSNVFGVMNNTRNLFLGSEGTAVESKTNNPFDSLGQLQQLRIANLNASILNQYLFKGLKNVEVIRIEGMIRLIEFDAFAEMPNLKQATLSKCHIEEISMDAFYGVKQLEIVDLSHNELTSLPNGLFDDHKRLQEIYLQNNLLTFLSNDFFTKIFSVKLVRLTENPWICNCNMLKWKQGITNKIRINVKNHKKCHNQDLKNIHCSNSDFHVTYAYDNKMSPRCNGGPVKVQYRSVYYAIRRDLRCVEKPTSHANPKKEAIANKYFKYQEALLHKNKFHRQLTNHTNNNNHMDVFKMKQQRLLAKAFARKVSKTVNTFPDQKNKLRYQLISQKKSENDNSLENDAHNNSIYY